MKKYLMMAVAAGLLAAPALVSEANAHDHDAAAEVSAEVAVDAVDAKLADGTHIRVRGTNVSVVAEDGSETPAPDGVHTLENGATVETLDGVIVEAAEEEAVEDDAAE
ncbi:MAG: hypothetical protein ACK4VI_04970 [Alphaproteobacteria bacterium]